jgi:hypothetical protein
VEEKRGIEIAIAAAAAAAKPSFSSLPSFLPTWMEFYLYSPLKIICNF